MKSFFVNLLAITVILVNTHGQTVSAPSAPEPLRSKIISKTGNIGLWSKSTSSMGSLDNSSDLQSGKTLILDNNEFIHLTFEPLIEMKIRGPASVVFENLVIDRSKGAIRMLCRMDKGTMLLKAPPQPGHVLLFTCTTPSAILDASAIDMTITVDSAGTTTTDIHRGVTKILPGSGTLKTVLNAGSRGIASPGRSHLATSALPDSAVQVKTPSSQRQPTIGILSIKSAQPGNNLEPVSNAVAQAFETSTNAKILFLDDVRKLLHTEGKEGLLTCFTDSCISRIGAGAGVDVVIVGNLGQLGTSYILDLRMIDVLRDKPISRASINVTDDPGKFLAEIPKAVTKLAAGDTTLSAVVKSSPGDESPPFNFNYQEQIVWIFPGKFVMGAHHKTGDVDELPTHEVSLDGFFIDRYEVTRQDFEKVMGYNPVPSKGCGTCPVTNVTWQEAADYCSKTGKRLPTEAEWEYACRGNTTTLYYKGVTLSSEDANFNGQQPFGGSPVGKFIGKAVPVGGYAPNKWNLHDMYGNAAEWCQDWYDIAYYGNSPKSNPKGPLQGKLKVVRGGSWNSAGGDLRSANRMAYNPELRLGTIGFRCVKDSDEAPAK